MQNEWLEKWERENAAPCRFFMDEAQDEKMVPLDAVRALLSRFVLCEKEPVAWRVFDGEGNWDVVAYDETYRDKFIERNGRKYADWVKPLYAPADMGKEGGE